ncbi:MAG: sulfite exporter TauE/SafE family protein [Oscillospiraceae bacterium]|nr:sulfite exporter TauE/SafE family protein [Oscillospiraceae bacterium]
MAKAKSGFLAGTAAGTFNGLFGSGGGTVLVPLLKKSGVPVKNAHAMSVAVILPVSIFSALLYSSEGFSVLAALPYLPGGLIGALCGAKLLPHIPQKALQQVFGLLILFSAVRLWMR